MTVTDICAQYGIGLSEQTSAWLECVDTLTVEYAASLPVTVVIIPLLFVVVFIAVSIVCFILFVILAGVLGFLKRRRGILSKLAGMVLGLLQGVVVAGMLFLPITGILDTADRAISNTTARYPESQNAVALGDMYEEYLSPVAENPVIKTYNKTLGFMYDKMAMIEMEGEEVRMVDVLADGVEIFTLYGDLGEVDFLNLNEEQKAIIDSIITVFNDDHYMTEVLSGALRAVCRAEQNGVINLEIEDEVSREFIVSFLHVFENSTYTTVQEDIRTVQAIYFLLSDSGALLAIGGENADGMALVNSLAKVDANGKSTLGSICTHLKMNVRTAPIATKLNNFAMSALLSSAGISDPNVAQRVEDVKNDLNEVIAMNKEDYATQEEYKEAVSTKINDTLVKNDIEITEEQLDMVSDFVIEEFDEIDEITDAEIADFMAKYYDVYMNGSEDGEIPEIPELPEGFPDIITP
jgi:uncharacterized membrane protein required for colicin V production